MSNVLKRVMSGMMREESSTAKTMKLDETSEKVAVSSEVNKMESEELGGKGDASAIVPLASNANVEKEDDDLFQDLTEPTERIIQKVSEMKIGEIYQLVDIYSMQVEDRLAIVGGFQLDEEPEIYVWMPTSLVRNYDAKKELELKDKINKGKKGYAVYKGLKVTKYNTTSYDIVWVQKKGN